MQDGRECSSSLSRCEIMACFQPHLLPVRPHMCSGYSLFTGCHRRPTSNQETEEEVPKNVKIYLSISTFCSSETGEYIKSGVRLKLLGGSDVNKTSMLTSSECQCYDTYVYHWSFPLNVCTVGKKNKKGNTFLGQFQLVVCSLSSITVHFQYEKSLVWHWSSIWLTL